jgi:hypothetical protein
MHVIICYAINETLDVARELREELRRLPDVHVWMDESPPDAVPPARDIQAQIDQTDVMIVLLSPQVREGVVLKEIEYARLVQTTILPIMVIETELPTPLKGHRYLDLTRNRPAEWRRLVADIRNRAGITDEVTVPIDRRRTGELPELDASPRSHLDNIMAWSPLLKVALAVLVVVGLAILVSQLLDGGRGKPIPMAAPTPSPTLHLPECFARTMTESVIARTAPQAGAPPLVSLPPQGEWGILGRTEDNRWWKLQIDDQSGWVSVADVQVIGENCNRVSVLAGGG